MPFPAWLTATILGVALTGLALRLGMRRQETLIRRQRSRLLSPQPLASTPAGRLLTVEPPLPPPVARYLRLALPEGMNAPRLVTLVQHGELRTDVHRTAWLPFSAIHTVAPERTAFAWDAKVKVAPFVSVRVLDSLVDGRGAGKVLLLSALDIGHDDGSPEISSGSLHRFLAEAVWYPWALRPSAFLTWQPIDESRAMATLATQDAAVSLEFRFSQDGEVTGIHTPARWGRFRGRYAKAAWEGHFGRYTRRDGVLVPLYGEVGWYVEERLELAWKGSITSVTWTP
jgi:hypothetical protein